MISKASSLSISRQCRLLSLSRHAYYYSSSKEFTEDERIILARMDQLYTAHPATGYRTMADLLIREGFDVTRKITRRYMQILGLKSIAPYKKKQTTISNKQHKKFKYLVRKWDIAKSGDVWATDITYIPFKGGFVYLTVMMDWHSRFILSWRLSTSMDTSFCIEALDEAMRYHRLPQIFNSDQGSQYTSYAFTQRLLKHGIPISMDGKGRYFDNIMVERLWRTIKHDFVYQHEFNSVRELKMGLEDYINYYNFKRPHQSLDSKTPYEVYRGW